MMSFPGVGRSAWWPLTRGFCILIISDWRWFVGVHSPQTMALFWHASWPRRSVYLHTVHTHVQTDISILCISRDQYVHILWPHIKIGHIKLPGKLYTWIAGHSCTLVHSIYNWHRWLYPRYTRQSCNLLTRSYYQHTAASRPTFAPSLYLYLILFLLTRFVIFYLDFF